MTRTDPPSAPSGDTTETRDLGTDLGLLALALIWGVNFSVIKVGLEVFHPFAFNALRFPLAAAVLYVLLRRRGPIPRPERSDWPRVIAIGLLGNLIYQYFFIVGLDLTTAGNASLLLATTPVWTLLLSVLSGHERPSRSVGWGIAGTVLGMALVVGGGSELSLTTSNLRGDLLVAGAAVAWSIHTVGARHLIHRYGSLVVTAWTLWVGTLGLVLQGLPWVITTDFGAVPALAWGAVAYAGVFAISIAYALWYRGVRRLGNARTSAYSNLVPVVALVVAWLWLREVPGWIQLVGASIILGGLSLARASRPRADGAALGEPPAANEG